MPLDISTVSRLPDLEFYNEQKGFCDFDPDDPLVSKEMDTGVLLSLEPVLVQLSEENFRITDYALRNFKGSTVSEFVVQYEKEPEMCYRESISDRVERRLLSVYEGCQIWGSPDTMLVRLKPETQREITDESRICGAKFIFKNGGVAGAQIIGWQNT